MFHPKHLWLLSKEESSKVPTWIQILQQKSLILEMLLCLPCSWAQQGLGSCGAARGACCPRHSLRYSQWLGINITEWVRAELFPQSVHIMDVNVKMPPSEVWAPWNETKNYWQCQLSGMLFRVVESCTCSTDFLQHLPFWIKGVLRLSFLPPQALMHRSLISWTLCTPTTVWAALWQAVSWAGTLLRVDLWLQCVWTLPNGCEQTRASTNPA